ncbi:MAG: hypothetical protein MN733_32765 [Nitrososphaera sp.]|nr:hypothetical protein [Nitrososphaera sp.]
MAVQVRRLQTNFSKGELSPLIEGRPDLASYFEGGSVIENFILLRQGGLARRVGTRFVAEAKFNNFLIILIPFESSVGDTYVLEFGDFYIRFYKNGVQLQASAGGPLEVVSPYSITNLPDLHYTQSVDVMFLFHPDHPQRKLSRLSDTNWVLTQIVFNPPPTFEADSDISGGTATLTPGAVSGNGVAFTASSAVWLAGDVGRLIIFGASRAVITAVSGAIATADILDVFPNTSPIPAGQWLLRLGPQVTLDPNIKEPIGAQVTLVAGAAAFRSTDVGKFIFIYGGLVRIDVFDSSTQVRGEILSVMGDATDANPPAAPAGAWTLEVASWSVANGFPRTGEFFQGRLVQASTRAEPSAIWFSRSDDFENYATGVSADDAISHTMATKQLNRIEWLADSKALFLGTMGSEHRITSGQTAEVLGGDVIPLVQRISSHGSSHIQPVLIGSRIIFVDRSLLRIMAILFSIEEDNFDPVEVTGAAEQITVGGLRLGPVALSRSPDPRIFYVRQDGTLVVLTYYYQEKVIGFTRLTTDGMFLGVAVTSRVGKPDQITVAVNRLVSSTNRIYIEVFEDNATELTGRPWTGIYTDSAKVYDLNGVSTTVFTGLGHLTGKAVEIVADGSVRPSQVVEPAGTITLPTAATEHVEIGLPYVSTITTMRPAIEGQMIEGLPRNWRTLFARLHQTIGGKLNSGLLLYPPSPLNVLNPFTGDVQITPEGNYDTDGRITVVQDQPYPMILLALFGELAIGDHG